MTTRRFSTVVASCAVAFVLAAGCSGDEGDDSSAESLSGPFDEIEGVEVSSDQTPITPEDRRLIALAEVRLTGDCMEAKGFDFTEVIDFKTSNHVPEAPVYLSPEELRRSGYQYDWQAAADSFLAANGPAGVPTFVEGMSQQEADAWSNAVLGEPGADQLSIALPDGSVQHLPKEGCGADARRDLYGSLENFARFDQANQALSHEGLARELAEIDSYNEPLEEWQSCMREAGFDVTNGDYGLGWLQARGAQALFEGGRDQGVIDADVIQNVAAADADCQESSGLYEVRSELLPDAERSVADRLGFEMSEYSAFQNAVLERAKQAD